MLSSTYAQQKAENHEMLKIILSSIRFLSEQGLGLWCRFKAGNDVSDGVSNFVQLLRTRATVVKMDGKVPR